MVLERSMTELQSVLEETSQNELVRIGLTSRSTEPPTLSILTMRVNEEQKSWKIQKTNKCLLFCFWNQPTLNQLEIVIFFTVIKWKKVRLASCLWHLIGLEKIWKEKRLLFVFCWCICKIVFELQDKTAMRLQEQIKWQCINSIKKLALSLTPLWTSSRAAVERGGRPSGTPVSKKRHFFWLLSKEVEV